MFGDSNDGISGQQRTLIRRGRCCPDNPLWLDVTVKSLGKNIHLYENITILARNTHKKAKYLENNLKKRENAKIIVF